MKKNNIAAKHDNTYKLYCAIKKDYDDMEAKHKFRRDYIIEVLAGKYYKSTHTINSIITKYDEWKR